MERKPLHRDEILDLPEERHLSAELINIAKDLQSILRNKEDGADAGALVKKQGDPDSVKAVVEEISANVQAEVTGHAQDASFLDTEFLLHMEAYRSFFYDSPLIEFSGTKVYEDGDRIEYDDPPKYMGWFNKVTVNENKVWLKFVSGGVEVFIAVDDYLDPTEL